MKCKHCWHQIIEDEHLFPNEGHGKMGAIMPRGFVEIVTRCCHCGTDKKLRSK